MRARVVRVYAADTWHLTIITVIFYYKFHELLVKSDFNSSHMGDFCYELHFKLCH